MRRNRMRLTESQLHRVVKESVKNVLREQSFKLGNNGYEEDFANDEYPYGETGSLINGIENGTISNYDVDALNRLCVSDSHFQLALIELINDADRRHH